MADGPGNGDPRLLPLVQGTLYILTGLWPLLHLRSFEWVTGRKRDRWLVKTTGALIAVIGAALARQRPADAETAALGLGSAFVLGSADAVYGGRGIISRVYLLDGLVEAVFALGWARRLVTGRRR